MNESFINWLEDFITSIENPELPDGKISSDYERGWVVGAIDTQDLIAKKLRYAINVEKERIQKEANP